MDKVLMPTLPFPPIGGVGVRRKAKIAKYLARHGIQVHVITTHNIKQENNYEHDILHENIVIKRIPSLSLHNFIRFRTNSFFIKAFRKILVTFTSPLFFIDYASLWGLVLIPYSIYYINKHQIKYVYCSGAPFSTLWHMSIVKRLLGKRIVLINEWRDLWAEDFYHCYPKPKILFKPLNVKAELSALSNCDAVVGVTPLLVKSLSDKLKNPTKVKVIENGYDPDEIGQGEGLQSNNNNCLKFTYTGSLGGSRREALFILLEAITRLKQAGLNIRVDIIGEADGSLLAKQYPELVAYGVLRVLGVLSPENAINYVKESDYAVVLVEKENPEALTSKFFEYCAVGKTLICVGPEGDLKEIVDTQKLGCYVTFDNPTASSVIEQFVLSGEIVPEENFARIRTEYNFENLTMKLWSLFKESLCR